MDIRKIIERAKQQTLTDQERAELYTIDILFGREPEKALAELIRFGMRHPHLAVFVTDPEKAGRSERRGRPSKARRDK